MKEKISRNKISRHYKSFFGLENMGLGENDNLMIDWGESLVNDFCNQEVEKRIAERMPSDEEIRDELCRHFYNWLEHNSFKDACKWLRSRLLLTQDQKKDKQQVDN